MTRPNVTTDSAIPSTNGHVPKERVTTVTTATMVDGELVYESKTIAPEMPNPATVANDFPVDVQGVANAFAFIHGPRPPNADVIREQLQFAYDTTKNVWRAWEYGKGWNQIYSVLPDITAITATLCQVSAIVLADGDEWKYQRQHRALRQRHLGGTVTRALKLAEVYLSEDGWDSNANLLGLPDGEVAYIVPSNTTYPVHVIDQESTDHITKSMAATPTTPTSLWLSFLEGLTGGNEDMESALQVWAGASLMEGNKEQKAHFLYGDGGTGKSVFLKAIQAAAGDYAGSARASTFTDDKGNHPAEKLPFIQNHIVVLPELPRGALRSELFNEVTGSDSISVRGMRENPRTETPKATLWFSANHLPNIQVVSEAIRRRILIWPCDNQPAKKDYNLLSNLTSPEHLGGVVGWLLEGMRTYLRIQNVGGTLPIPNAVKDATETYLREADMFGQWAREWLVDGGETTARTLYRSYSAWCTGRKRRPLAERMLGEWLGRKYEKRRTRAGYVYPVSFRV